MNKTKYTIQQEAVQCPLCMNWKDVEKQFKQFTKKNESLPIQLSHFSVNCEDCDIRFTAVIGMNGLQTLELLVSRINENKMKL